MCSMIFNIDHSQFVQNSEWRKRGHYCYRAVYFRGDVGRYVRFDKISRTGNMYARTLIYTGKTNHRKSHATTIILFNWLLLLFFFSLLLFSFLQSDKCAAWSSTLTTLNFVLFFCIPHGETGKDTFFPPPFSGCPYSCHCKMSRLYSEPLHTTHQVYTALHSCYVNHTITGVRTIVNRTYGVHKNLYI